MNWAYDALPELIRDEIKAREWFILCDSPNAQTSKWVQEEVAMIQAMEGKVFKTVDLRKELETELHKLVELPCITASQKLAEKSPGRNHDGASRLEAAGLLVA